MDVDNNFCMEEELLGSDCRRESAEKWSCYIPQETVAKETKKRPRERTMKIEQKNMGPKGKAGDGPVDE